jgi:hypothetical protein
LSSNGIGGVCDGSAKQDARTTTTTTVIVRERFTKTLSFLGRATSVVTTKLGLGAVFFLSFEYSHPEYEHNYSKRMMLREKTPLPKSPSSAVINGWVSR